VRRFGQPAANCFQSKSEKLCFFRELITTYHVADYQVTLIRSLCKREAVKAM
jgi:hypothetical protein